MYEEDNERGEGIRWEGQEEGCLWESGRSWSRKDGEDRGRERGESCNVNRKDKKRIKE